MRTSVDPLEPFLDRWMIKRACLWVLQDQKVFELVQKDGLTFMHQVKDEEEDGLFYLFVGYPGAEVFLDHLGQGLNVVYHHKDDLVVSRVSVVCKNLLYCRICLLLFLHPLEKRRLDYLVEVQEIEFGGI